MVKELKKISQLLAMQLEYKIITDALVEFQQPGGNAETERRRAALIEQLSDLVSPFHEMLADETKPGKKEGDE